MKIATANIKGFEEMTDAEKVAALLDLEIDVPDDSENLAKYKKLLNDATGEASKYKKALRERESQEETRNREAAEESEKLKARLAEFERRDTVSKHLANFMDVGYGKDLAEKSAEAIADGDFGVVFDNLRTFIANMTESVKADVLKSTPAPKHGGSESTVTKEQFSTMSLGERQKLFTENRELYDELSK